MEGNIQKPLRTDADHETTVLPLVAVLGLHKLFGACRVLFINVGAITLSSEINQVSQL